MFISKHLLLFGHCPNQTLYLWSEQYGCHVCSEITQMWGEKNDRELGKIARAQLIDWRAGYDQ